MIKDLIRSFVGEANRGRLDFFQQPNLRNSWGGPFNGQKFRQRIFFDIMYFFPIKAIVETGTYRGTTTALFLATSLPVYTVETNLGFYSYAKMRFLFNKDNAHLYHNDSRAFLRDLSKDSSIPKEDVFFYLDAHWGDDLPLQEELKIIFSKWKKAIVMIDDFHVPDSDYSFDDYGRDKVLNLRYLKNVLAAHKISVFYPSANSSEETGARRGSIILCQDEVAVALNTKITTLVEGASHLKDY